MYDVCGTDRTIAGERERARVQTEREIDTKMYKKQQQTQKNTSNILISILFFLSLLQPESRNTIFTSEKATTTDHIGIQTPNERACTLKLVYEPISISFRSWYERPEREIAKHARMNVRYWCVLAVWMCIVNLSLWLALSEWNFNTVQAAKASCGQAHARLAQMQR